MDDITERRVLLGITILLLHLFWGKRIVSQVWYLIVSIPDLCNLTYFQKFESS